MLPPLPHDMRRPPLFKVFAAACTKRWTFFNPSGSARNASSVSRAYSNEARTGSVGFMAMETRRCARLRLWRCASESTTGTFLFGEHRRLPFGNLRGFDERIERVVPLARCIPFGDVGAIHDESLPLSTIDLDPPEHDEHASAHETPAEHGNVGGSVR